MYSVTFVKIVNIVVIRNELSGRFSASPVNLVRSVDLKWLGSEKQLPA